MRMRDDGAFDRAPRVDVEVAGRAVQALGPSDDEVARARTGIGHRWDGHHHAPSSQQRDTTDVGHQADSMRGARQPFGSVLNYF
jgi:hypothetical protein